MPFGTYLSGAMPTVAGVPQWIVLLVVAVVGWLALSVVGGLLIGRLLGLANRRRPARRRRIAT